MKSLNLNEAIRIFFLVLITTLILTAVNAEVPKSETIIIPGELNDSLDNAQYFNIQTEYTYGNNTIQPIAQGLQATALSTGEVNSFRKTYVPKKGVMIVTLNFEQGSYYNIDVYNSCKENLCMIHNGTETQQHCVINVVPDYYYFKVTRKTGNGKHFLDVDYLNGHNDSAITATTCSPPVILDYYPNRKITIGLGETQDFNLVALDKEKSNLLVRWFVNDLQKAEGSNHYTFTPNTVGDYVILATVLNAGYTNRIDWNVKVIQKTTACVTSTDCETNQMIQRPYCSNNSVYTQWTNYSCINPGTKESYCEENIENKLIETCNNKCTNGTCTPSPILLCPYQEVGDDYQFKWDANEYTSSVYLEFSPDETFKTKTRVLTTTINPTPITKYYKTLINYEKLSKEKRVYSRIVGKNKLGKTANSNVCKFILQPPIKSITSGSNYPIDENFIFTPFREDSVDPKVQISYTNQFQPNKTLSIPLNENDQAPVKNYYKTLVAYEQKSVDKKLYTRVFGTDKYGRDTSGVIGDFTLRQPITPILTCPTENINSNYLFNWNIKEYFQTVTIDFSYDVNFKTKTSVVTTAINPTPITKYYKTLQKYSLKTSTKNLYARISAKSEYGQIATSNICVFKLNTTTLSKENQNTTAYFKLLKNRTTIDSNTQETFQTNNILPPPTPKETILSQTTEISETGETTTTKIIQVINEKGEIETGVEYEITESPLSQYNSNNILITPSSTTCTYNSSSKTLCEKKGDSMKLNNSSTIFELRYTYIDCTTGEILGKGQLCPGESGPWHHVPKDHVAKFEYKRYRCANNGCKTETLNLCSDVTCSNYCMRELKYSNGYCDQGVCEYTYMDCPIDCSEGQCTSNNCTSGWKCFNAIEKGYQNSNCDWSEREYCSNGCSNGKCNSQTCSSGWKCQDSTTRAFQNSNCSWDYETYCPSGCSNGSCNSNTCSSGWKCKDSETKAYRNSSCTWLNETYCPNGCISGSCSSEKEPGDEDYCSEGKPCQAGEGNCHNGNECQTGLYCMQDAGASYGYSSNVNVCEAREGAGEWKCINSSTLGFKLYETGEWSDNTYCQNGCEEGSCMNSLLKGPDTDKDGYTNEDEALAGSDPNNFNSTPFTEFAKYSEEIKSITQMNETDVFTNILLPFLAQNQNFENKTTKQNAIYFTGKDTNKAKLSIMNPLAARIGYLLGVETGGLLATGDAIQGVISLIGLPAFIGEAILSFGTYIINFNKVSSDLGEFTDYLAHSTVTFDSVTGTLDSTGQTLNLIWDSYYKQKLTEGRVIAKILPIIVQDAEDEKSFAYSYAGGYTDGYVVMTAASFGYGAGEVKAIIGGIKLGKLGTIAELYSKIARYPKLILLIIKGDDTSQIVINLVNKYSARLVNSVMEQKSTIKNIMEIAENKNGVVWLEKGNETAGWTHIVEGKIKTGAFRNAGIKDNVVQETIFKSVTNPTKTIPSITSNGFCYVLEGVAKYPIITMVGSNGFIVTSHPEDKLVEFICK